MSQADAAPGELVSHSHSNRITWAHLADIRNILHSTEFPAELLDKATRGFRLHIFGLNMFKETL